MPRVIPALYEMWGCSGGASGRLPGLTHVEYFDYIEFNNYWFLKRVQNIHDVQFSHKTQMDFRFSQHSPPPFSSLHSQAHDLSHRAVRTATLWSRRRTLSACGAELDLREPPPGLPPTGIHTALVLRAAGKRRWILYTTKLNTWTLTRAEPPSFSWSFACLSPCRSGFHRFEIPSRCRNHQPCD